MTTFWAKRCYEWPRRKRRNTPREELKQGNQKMHESNYTAGTIANLLVLVLSHIYIPRPAVRTGRHSSLERVPANLGQNHRPQEPVNSTKNQNSNTDDTVEPVWKVEVLVLVGRLGRNEWRDDEVHIREEEETSDGEGGLDGWVPIVFLSVKVEPDETECDERVDHREGVRDDVED